MHNKITWALSIFVAFILVQSLFFKFSGAEETTIIFTTVANWFASIGLSSVLTTVFASYGGYAVGTFELIAALLILNPKTRVAGALISLSVISGAIFFHLFTPLGIDRVVDAAGNTDGGGLFYTACAVWISSLAVFVLSKRSTHAAQLNSTPLAAARS